MIQRPTSRSRSSRPIVEELESRLAPAGLFVVGPDQGRKPEVRFFDALTGARKASLMPYGARFRGGVRVAVGDVNADQIPDFVVAPGVGISSTIKVFNGRDLRPLATFTAFGPGYKGGAHVAVGDLDANGRNEVIVGAARGKAQVRTFSVLTGEAVALPGALGQILAFQSRFTGGVTVAAGNVDGRFGDELIVGAGPGGKPTVKVFGKDGNRLSSFHAYGRGFQGGVYVAAGDVNNDGSEEIVTGSGSGRSSTVNIFAGGGGTRLATFQAFASGFEGGVRVGTADVNDDGRVEIIAAAGPRGKSRTQVFHGQTFQTLSGVNAFPTQFKGGVFGAGTRVETFGDPAFFQVQAEVNVLNRLARFVPGAVPQVADWVTVAANDPNLDPNLNGGKKNLYVITHGWAPGFQKMVQMNSTPGDPLLWWETLNTSLPGSPGAPASAEMFYGAEGSDIIISPNGLANAILQADPDAVVLAYSWIDESATGTFAGTIPEGAYLSEAYTVMNGYRLANALQMVLPGVFHANGGQMHLIGHSHGSKVATVATDQLTQTNNANFEVAHLTILDSPENENSTLVEDSDSANNLWYFLGNLDIGRDPGETFVDNYISAFDTRFGVIQGFKPLNTGQQTGVLQEIVDVTLASDVLYSSLDPLNLGDRHGYAFSWYGGASEAWAQNPTPTVADQWSPLINPATAPNLAGSYTQTWTASNQNQFQLTPGPQTNTVTDTPTFTNLAFTSTSTSGGGSFNANTGTVVLTETGNSTATFTGEFKPLNAIDGISFNFQFTNPGAGDQLVISVDTGTLFSYQIYFVMTGTVAGTNQGFATLSLASLGGFFTVKHDIQIQLIPATGSPGASVTITNLQQFTS